MNYRFMPYLFLLFVSLDAFSLENLKWFTEDYPPFNYRNKESKRLSGISIELLEATHRHLYKKGQIRSKLTRSHYRLVPWQRGYSKAQIRGKKNVIFSTTRTEEREEKFKWFGPIAKNINAIFALRGAKKLTSQNVKNELKRGKIVSVRGDVAVDLVKGLGLPDQKIAKVNGISQMLKMVQSRKMKYFAYGSVTSFYTMKKKGIDVKKFEIVYNMGESELWYAVNKSVSNKTISGYQSALEEVKRKDDSLKKNLLNSFNIKTEEITLSKSLFSKGQCPHKKVKCGHW